jgi:predicted RNA-binding Zn-ribbon protein involved in translation (DUF1610 family)
LKFDCPKCGQPIRTKLTVGEFISCDNCNAYLKILSEDIAAVVSGGAPAAEEGSEFDVSETYGNAALKILSEEAVTLVSTDEPQEKETEEVDRSRQLIMKHSGGVGADRSLIKGFKSEDTFLSFRCPQCDSPIETGRSVGQSVKCYNCKADLKILSEDAVAILSDVVKVKKKNTPYGSPPGAVREIRERDRSSGEIDNAPAKKTPSSRSRQKSEGRLGGIPVLIAKTRAVLIDAIVVFIIILSLVLLVGEVMRNVVIISPISVSVEIQRMGYSPERLADRLLDQVQMIAEGGKSNFKKTRFPVLEKPGPLPEMVIAGSGFSFHSIVLPVKRLFGRYPAQISGEIIADDGLLCMTIRITEKKTENARRRRDIYGRPTDLNLILQQAAQFILEIIEPRTLTAFLQGDEGDGAGFDFRVVLPTSMNLPAESSSNEKKEPLDPETLMEELEKETAAEAEGDSG